MLTVFMKKLLIFCCIVLASQDAWSCDITVDSIVTAENNDTQLDWPWTITIDSTDGSDSESCLINPNVHCKTLGFVLNNSITEYSQATCLQLVLSKNSPSQFIPHNALTLTDLSLYFVSEGDAVITCENSDINMGNAGTAWSIQNASFVVFKSLQFSNCNQRLEIVNVTDVYFENVEISEFRDSGLRLLNNFNITLKNLTIVNCSHQLTSQFTENSALSLVYQNSGQKAFSANIFNSQFQYNSAILEEPERSSEGVLGEDFLGRGGAIGIFIDEPIKDTAVTMIIDNCHFTNNTADAYGGAVYLSSGGLSSGHRITVINSVFNRNYAAIDGGGFAQGSTKSGDFNITTVFTPSHYQLDNCNFTQNSAKYGGGVGFIIGLHRKRTTDTVSINNCIFDGNIGSTIGAAIMISSLTVPHLPEQDFPYNISNCTFMNNTSPNGILGITFKDLEFYGTNHFIHNHGPSIRAADSTIEIRGDVNFLYNVAENFNGVLQVQDFVQFQLFSGSHMYFHQNYGITASVFAVFLQEYPRSFAQLVNNPWCFLLHEDVERRPSEWTDVSITFDNNTAFLAPNIYISNFDLCSWQNTSDNQVYFSDEEVLKWPVFDYRNFTILNEPMATESESNSSAFSKNEGSGIRTAATNIFGTKNYRARPGQPIELDLVPYDSFNRSTAFVFGFTQFTGDGSVPSGRLAQYIDLSDERDKDVLLEPNIKEYLPGLRTVKLTYGLLPDSISLRNFTIAVFTAVKVDVSDVPVTYVDIMVDKCLPGQTLRKANSDSSTLTCECDFKTASKSILSCEADEMIILRDGLFAFNRSSQVFSSLQIFPCPPNYCQCRKGSISSTLCDAVYNYTDEEQQCHPDREGVLCGQCRHDHQGVGVLTMLCQNCDNYNVVFIPLLVLLDVVLVILILYSGTPFPPSLKGILFYIQAMPRAVAFFPLSTWRGTQFMLYISSALSLYFPWDFCLYEGMTALASHFFTYTPFIIAVIIVTVILKYRPHGYTSPKGKKFQEVYHKFRSKCAHGIWTLVLLMFLRISHNSWLITNCVYATDDELSWYRDGSVQCFNNYKHLLLFLFGLMVMLFTSALIIYIWLLTIGGLDIMTNKYAIQRRLYESAIHGYKEKYKWWAFVDIVRRYVLALYWGNLLYSSSLQIFIFLPIFVAHTYAQPYKKVWHNWLESFLLLYIIVLLLLRSTNFVIDSLLPNAYAGLMLPSENIYDRTSTATKDSLPPSDMLTYFFVPLICLPLTIVLAIIGRYVILWLYNCLLYCFDKLKPSRNVPDKRELVNSFLQAYEHDDKEVLVTHRDGRTTRVTVTYAEY